MPLTPLLRSREQFPRSVRELFTSWPTVAAAVVVGIGVLGCSSEDASGEAGPPVTVPGSDVGSVTTDVVDGIQPVGFSTVEARVTTEDGEVCEMCLWLADTADERSLGLMGVTDLGDADGMLFVWESPAQSNFVMIGTPTPLSIAWFGGDGALVGEADMEPCLDADSSVCDRYSAAGPYTAAIEVFQGGLDDLGIGPGARLEILAETEAAACAPT